MDRAVGREARSRGPALTLHVGLVLVVPAVAAQQQLREDDARRVAAVDEVALRPVAGVVVTVGVGDVQNGVAVLVRRHGDPHQHRLRQNVEQHRLALEAHAVLAHHVADLVAEERRQGVVGEPQLEHAAGDEDVPAGQGEGVRLRHVRQEERDRIVVVVRLFGDPVADFGHPGEGLRIVPGAVDAGGLRGGLQALAEELLVGRPGPARFGHLVAGREAPRPRLPGSRKTPGRGGAGVPWSAEATACRSTVAGCVPSLW